MLASESDHSELNRQQGSDPVSLAELRSRLACPSSLPSVHQQRLWELARRLARVRALGGEYARLGLSENGTAAMDCAVAAV